jgi:hypothetical protein
LNDNARPEGYLMPESTPPAAGVRPFVPRRVLGTPVRMNHTAPLPAAGESIPLPEHWCYRCFQPSHLAEFQCWPELRPVTPKRGAQLVALAAREAAGVPRALASWTADDEQFLLDVAAELCVAAVAAGEARIRAAARREFRLTEPVRLSAGTVVERFGRTGMVVEDPPAWSHHLVPVVFDDEPGLMVGFPLDEWTDLAPVEMSQA